MRETAKDYQWGDWALFCDQLAIHKSKEVREACKELGIKLLLNVPYQPDYNPVESCISKIKSYYKKNKLRLLANEEIIDYAALIEESCR